MYIEHIVFSLALAIVISLFFKREYAIWCVLIIVVSACVPDIDGIFSIIRSPPVFSDGIVPHMAFHERTFHSIGVLAVYSIAAGALLARYYQMEFRLVSVFAGIGFAAHLVEDALVYNPASAIFWPFSSQEVGIGSFPSYSRNFFSIADAQVLGIGMILLSLAVLAGVLANRTSWLVVPWSRKPLFRLPFIPSPVPEPVHDETEYEPDRGNAVPGHGLINLR